MIIKIINDSKQHKEHLYFKNISLSSSKIFYIFFTMQNIKEFFNPNTRMNRLPFFLTWVVIIVASILITPVITKSVGTQPILDTTMMQDQAAIQTYVAETNEYMLKLYTHPLMLLFIIVSMIVSTIAYIRRLHDLDKSGRRVLLAIVPFANLYIIFICLFLRGTKGDNRFGPDPLGSNTPEFIQA